MTQSQSSEVFVVGGGPAGLAAAIAARQLGLRVTVADARHPPIDKACGEGLMPEAVKALHALGVSFSAAEAIPFRGIRFVDGRSGQFAETLFAQGIGLAVRRTTLHAKLTARAAEVGADLRWGSRIVLLKNGPPSCNGEPVAADWIVGADGQQSQVRRWAYLETHARSRQRFGFRKHFRIAPWTDFVEVYWVPRCQIAVTPTAPNEVGLALISRDSTLRIDTALRGLPALAEKLVAAESATLERGAPCSLRRLPSVTRGRVGLIGDASGSVDPVTGEGLGLAFRQALTLAEAMRAGNLAAYQRAHRRIGAAAHRLSQLAFFMDRHPGLQQRALSALTAEPQLFARLINTHSTESPTSMSQFADALRFGWKLARS
jgi:2-polyprenyl-6-methoxyphenol hydroxylase-like FAD-dependent oxidoreductase